MTISTTTNRDAFTGDGSQTSYPLSFPVVSSTHIDVNVNDATIVASGNYTVTIVGTSATVVFTTAPASAAKIVIRRIVPQTQTVDYVPYDTFPAETHEAALDKLTQVDQQLQEDINRSMQLPVSDNTTSSYIPSPSAGKALKWNAAGTALENSADAVDGITTAAAASATASATSATASAASATASASSETASATSATAAAASLASFTGQYHGASATDPTTGLDEGDLYFNSVNDVLMTYTGSSWVRCTPTTTDQGHINTVSGINAAVSGVSAISAAVSGVNAIAGSVSAVAADSSDIGAVAAKATEIGRLGTADAVADLSILGTADVVVDMNVLGTASNVTAMGLLGTSDAVSDINTLGTAANVTAMDNCSGSIANINTVAGGITDINRYAAEYTIASSAPGSPSSGDLWYDSSATNLLKFYNGTAWVGIAPGITTEVDPNAAALALALG